MNSFAIESLFFSVVLSITGFEIGLFLKKKFSFPLFNPLLIAILFVIGFLLIFHIDYSTYASGAQYISYLLTPSTVCLAVPLYKQWNILKENKGVILVSVLVGTITSLVITLLICILFRTGHEIYVTLLPKSITTAIGIGISEELGGITTITVAIIVLTGVLGNVIGESIFHLFHIQDPLAKGLSLGTSSHAIGTSKAMELGELEGAMSSLALAIAGLYTVIGANIFALFY